MDTEIANQTTYAQGEAPSGTDVTTGTPPSASANSGTGSGGTQVSVAAAVAVNVSTSTAQATIPSGIVATAGGLLSLLSANATSGSTKADGSAVNTGTSGNPSGVAIGAAVAINFVTADNEATIGAGATVAAVGINLHAVTNGTTNPADSFTAMAFSGNGGANIGVTGALAINVAGDTAQAAILGSASVNAGSGDVTLTAADSVGATSSAMPTSDSPTSSGKVGIGASVALNIINETVTAQLADGATLSNANNLSLSTTSSDTVTTTAQMGGSAGSVSITPAVGLAIVKNTANSELGTPGATS